MAPTFLPGDVLYVRRIARIPYPGDVIVFETGYSGYIVHRVVRVDYSQGKITTRGDNNHDPDTETVAPQQVLGEVVATESRAGLRRLQRGFFALLSAQVGWKVRGVAHALRDMLWEPYDYLRRSEACRRALKYAFGATLTTVSLNTSQGRALKTLFRRRTVAVYYADQNRFMCRKPFDLFIKPPSDSR